MTKLLRDLWIDERGIILSAELLIIATIMCCGVVVGWVVVRDAIVQELADVGNAISSLNQSYSFTGYNHSDGNKTLATCSGSSFTDTITLSQVSSTGASGANGGANLAGGFAAGAGASGARAAGASAARVQVNEFNVQAETKTAEVKAEATAKVQQETVKTQDACELPTLAAPNTLAFGPNVLNGPALVPQAVFPTEITPQSVYTQGVNPQSYVPQTYSSQTFVPQTFVPQTCIPQTFVPQAYGPMMPHSFVPVSPYGDRTLLGPPCPFVY